jgi:hypothetical protein
MQPGQELTREAKAEGLLLIATVSVYIFLLSSSGLTSFLSSFVVTHRETAREWNVSGVILKLIFWRQ